MSVESSSAFCHITSRGNLRDKIFYDAADKGNIWDQGTCRNWRDQEDRGKVGQRGTLTKESRISEGTNLIRILKVCPQDHFRVTSRTA